MNRLTALLLCAIIVPAMAVAGQPGQQPGEQPGQEQPGMEHERPGMEREREMEREHDPMAEHDEREKFMQQKPRDAHLTDDIIGASVRGREDEEIGTIEDLIIGQDGEVQGVVLSVGGFLGIGDHEVAASWDQLNVRQDPDDPEDLRIEMEVTQQELEQAPEFQRDADDDQENDTGW